MRQTIFTYVQLCLRLYEKTIDKYKTMTVYPKILSISIKENIYDKLFHFRQTYLILEFEYNRQKN